MLERDLFSRREFLIDSVLTGILGLVSACTPKPKEVRASLTYFTTKSNIKIVYDPATNRPLIYQYPGGREVSVNQDGLPSLQTKAKESKKPHLIALINPANPILEEDVSSSDHPVAVELPSDVLLEAELKEHGIKIVQAENTNLFIRKQAFQKGGILEPFNKQGRSLTIVLINGPVVSIEFMEEEKYALFRQYACQAPTDEDIEEYRQRKIQEYQEKFKKGSILKTPLELQIEEALLREMSEHQLLILRATENCQESATFVSLEGGKKNLIILGVGKKLPVSQKEVIYFDENGTLNYLGLIQLDLTDFSPKKSQSYPNPDDLQSVTSNLGYVYGAKNPGFNLRHELGHLLTFNETYADMLAIESLTQAWENWQKNGDNRGYCFVFSLPEGGHILTEGEKPQPSSKNT